VNFIFDADVASFFDSVSKDWLVRFVEQRIGDLRIIRLIQKWLKAGVLENGVVTVSEKGTGQGLARPEVSLPSDSQTAPVDSTGGPRGRLKWPVARRCRTIDVDQGTILVERVQ
jgi:hypothetical protein